MEFLLWKLSLTCFIKYATSLKLGNMSKKRTHYVKPKRHMNKLKPHEQCWTKGSGYFTPHFLNVSLFLTNSCLHILKYTSTPYSISFLHKLTSSSYWGNTLLSFVSTAPMFMGEGLPNRTWETYQCPHHKRMILPLLA